MLFALFRHCAPAFSRRLQALALALVIAALPAFARAADYTDLWWVPSESGWGVNIVQSDSFMFATFFIYGQDRKPTWYTAQMTRDATGAYSGGLFLTSGSYYALPWNPDDTLPGAQQVGTATFQPDALKAYLATLTYVVDGIGTVQKSIERQTLTPIALGGAYTGGMSASQRSCNNASSNGAFKNSYDLQVTVTSTHAATLAFTFPTYACVMSGTLTQHGSQYTMTGASYACTQGGRTVFSTTANLFEIKATAQGIEGRWGAAVGSGCQEAAQFSAVLL